MVALGRAAEAREVAVEEPRINLVGATPEELREILPPHLDRPFRLGQVLHWVVRRHVPSFDRMSDLPAELRRALAERFRLDDPELVQVVSSDDGCDKLLFRLADGAKVEAVTMPTARKVTFCLSSQTGCALGCAFCVTGQLGAGRNLSAAEMIGQYRVMLRHAGPELERVNVVFMGMGEPLLNTRELGRALAVLYPTVSPRRITVSTAGVLAGIRWLAGLKRRPKLAISLNAPDQERRERLMPIARAAPLPELLAELARFPLERGRRLTFEYVLIRGFNDATEDAHALADLLRPFPAKTNLSPLNPDPVHLPGLQAPAPAAVEAFAGVLRARGLVATLRYSRGADVAAACGQLKGSAQAQAAPGDGA
jgi:23S rRNA (adenine2503-C2)-methyltransferase